VENAVGKPPVPGKTPCEKRYLHGLNREAAVCGKWLHSRGLWDKRRTVGNPLPIVPPKPLNAAGFPQFQPFLFAFERAEMPQPSATLLN
jgi:hypothetical protein